MSKYVCTVNFHFEGVDESNRRDRKLMENMKEWYMDLRDRVIGITNPLLESWNKEFNTIYGDVDLTKDQEMSLVYESFIKGKFDPIFETFDDLVYPGFRMRYEPDKDFVGIYEKRHKKATVFMTVSDMREI